MLDILMFYTLPQCLPNRPEGFKLFACIYRQSGNNLDLGQLDYSKPADLDLNCLQVQIYPGLLV